MGRKNIEVNTLYGLTVEDLNKISNNSKSNFTKTLIQAVIMRYNGIPTATIMKTLSKSKPTIVAYINKWNAKGIAAITDKRGGNVESKITDEIEDEIRFIVTNQSPHDFGYEQNKWSTSLISKFIEDKYGNKYSKAWMSILLKKLGFSYKRGVYKPTLGNPELQDSHKKYEFFNGYH